MSIKKQGDFLESKIKDYFEILKDDISENINSELEDFYIENIKLEEVQAGGNQGGKDKIIILESKHLGKQLSIPIYTEVKSHAHKGKSENPNTLELYKKILQVSTSDEAKKYLREPYSWFSYLVFLPFTYLSNQDFSNIIAYVESDNIQEFPDHYWLLQNTPQNTEKILAVDNNYISDISISGLFSKEGHSSCLDVDSEFDFELNKKRQAKSISNNILKAKVKSENNFSRTRRILSETDTDTTREQLKNESEVVARPNIKDFLEYTENKLLEQYKEDIENADISRVDYLIRSLLIRKYGGSISGQLVNIEEEYYSMTKAASRFYKSYDGFEQLETRIDDMVSRFRGFGKYDKNEGLIDTFLFPSERSRQGCFYELLTQNKNKLKLNANNIQISNNDNK